MRLTIPSRLVRLAGSALLLLATGCATIPRAAEPEQGAAMAVGGPVAALIPVEPLLSSVPPADAPTFRLPSGVAPLEMQVRLKLDPDSEDFSGRVTLPLQVESPTRILWLTSKGLTIGALSLTQSGRSVPLQAVHQTAEFLGIEPTSPLSIGRAELVIEYRGKLEGRESRSVFRQQHRDRWYLYTHFQPTDARRAFPCFDEPAFKVPWQLTLEVPKGMTAVSNTLEASRSPLPTGGDEVRFKQTLPLPSYLVAVAVGPFEVLELPPGGSRGIPHRIVAPAGELHRADIAAGAAPDLLEKLETYFGQPVPYDKLDHLAIPATYGFGAMENPGLITYDLSRLLISDADKTEGNIDWTTDTIAHEMAHLWFGDLVTPAYWNDIWLNESFATWLAAVVVDQWKPEWKVREDAVRQRGWAMGADSISGARPVLRPIHSQGDIDQAFDGISYSKGGALLTMFEQWLGPERFREGVRTYLSRHANGVATSDDFLEALGAVGGAATSQAFRTFLNQPGIPQIQAGLSCRAGAPPALELSQSRYKILGSHVDPAQTWNVPICVRLEGRSEPQCQVFSEPQQRIELLTTGCPAWVHLNPGHSSYFRVAYAPPLLEPLLTPDLVPLSSIERYGILEDLLSLVSTGAVPLERLLAIVPGHARSENEHLVTLLSGWVAGLSDRPLSAPLAQSYRRYIHDQFGPRARQLGFTPAPGDSEDRLALRRSLLSLLADQGEDGALRREALELATRWLNDPQAVSPEMSELVLRLAALTGDRTYFEALKQGVYSSQDRSHRRKLYAALASFRDPELHQQVLELTLDARLDPRECLGLIPMTMGDPSTREQTFQFFKQHADALLAKLPPSFKQGVPWMAASFCDADRKAEIETLLRPRLKDVPGADHSLEGALEVIDICIASRAHHQAGLEGFFAAYGQKGSRR